MDSGEIVVNYNTKEQIGYMPQVTYLNISVLVEIVLTKIHYNVLYYADINIPIEFFIEENCFYLYISVP